MSEETRPLEEVPSEPDVVEKKINWRVMLKRCVGEALGTAVLVTVGCGAAVGLSMAGASIGTIAVAVSLAFGLVVTALSYALGEFTGCHVNPAVTFAVWMDGRIGYKQALVYTSAQVVGGLIGGALLVGFFGIGWTGSALEATQGIVATYASNEVSGSLMSHYGSGLGQLVGFAAEVFFALFFIFTILCTSHDKANKGLSGIALGLSLTSIVFFGFGVTGTGVNPARSLGTAVMALANGQVAPIQQFWIFLFGPYLGAALATLAYWVVWHDYGPHFPHDGKRRVKEKIQNRVQNSD